MQNSKYSVSVIMPIYNEQALIRRSVDHVDTFLAEHFTDYEIIIVESGSTDDSPLICDHIEAEHSHIRVMHEGARNGFGSALKLGYRHAEKDLVWLITVDMPFPLESILCALTLLDRFDCVVSYRSKSRRNAFRHFQSFIYNTIVKSALHIRAKHVSSAFKLFKRDLIKNMPLLCNGWMLDAEILYRLEKKGIPYAEIPVPVLDRTQGRSSIKLFTFMSVLKELVYFARNKDRQVYGDAA